MLDIDTDILDTYVIVLLNNIRVFIILYLRVKSEFLIFSLGGNFWLTGPEAF